MIFFFNDAATTEISTLSLHDALPIYFDLLAEAFDCAEVRQASPDEVRAATGFAVGGVPPFGHDLPVVFDEALCDHDVIYAAGGDGNTLFAVDPKTLARAIEARIIRVGERV